MLKIKRFYWLIFKNVTRAKGELLVAKQQHGDHVRHIGGSCEPSTANTITD